MHIKTQSTHYSGLTLTLLELEPRAGGNVQLISPSVSLLPHSPLYLPNTLT